MNYLGMKCRAAVWLAVSIFCLANGALAQSPQHESIAPTIWLMEKANLQHEVVNSSRVHKIANGLTLRIAEIAGPSEKTSKVYSLRVVGKSKIEEFEREVQTLYGRPEVTSDQSMIWYIKDMNSTSYVLEVLNLSSEAKLVSAHEGVRTVSSLQKMSRGKKSRYSIGKRR